MKKTVLAIFAHPDDEAFGPGGTLAKFSQTHDVYLICATQGEKGKNSLKTSKKLHEIRKLELENSAKILGIKKVFCLGFVDGTLSNNLYHKLASKIEEKIKKINPEIIITFEPRGVSGHIDHITISLATTYVVCKHKNIQLFYYCMPEKERAKARDDYFIYFPKGYKEKEVDWVNDIKDTWDTKVKAMKAHKSQKHDADVIIELASKLPKRELFLKFKR